MNEIGCCHVSFRCSKVTRNDPAGRKGRLRTRGWENDEDGVGDNGVASVVEEETFVSRQFW